MLNNRRVLLLAFLATLILAGAAWWLGPVTAARAQLELLALDEDYRFDADARLAPALDSTGRPLPRFSLIMALRNAGTRTTAPRTLDLFVPGWIRLYAADGTPLPFEDAGEELVRFRIALQGENVEPGALPLVPAGLDRLWIGAELSPITCRERWDGVPELAPTPEYDRTLLSTVEAYYALESRGERHTGRLRLRLDPALVEESLAEPSFNVGPVRTANDGVTVPRLPVVTLEGRRTVACGAPEQRLPLESIVWRTDGPLPIRWIQIVKDGAVRRMLYDTTGDLRVDYEVWDSDADGIFEAGRSASYPVPAFLLPLRPQPMTRDTVSAAPPGSQVTIDSAVSSPRDSQRVDSARTATDSARMDSAAARRDTLQRARPDSGPRGRIVAEALRLDSLRRDSLLRRDSIRRARRDTTGRGEMR